MTAVTHDSSAGTAALIARSLGEPRLLRGTAELDMTDLRNHLRVHGPSPRLDLAHLVTACSEVALNGRGGAGFPVARKLAALGSRRRAVIVVNGSESEPASHKDRALMTLAPHLVLDGAQLVAEATGASVIEVAVHDATAAATLSAASTQRTGAARITVSDVAGGFVGGEARALLRGMSGGPALPPGRRILPTERGLDGAPTFVSNAETFAQLAVLSRGGPARFASVGTAAEPGTMLVTLSGAITQPMVAEAPIGTPLSTFLAAAGRPAPLAVVTGGYHGSWIAPRADIAVSRQGLHGVGGTLGAGVLIALDGRTCALGELERVAAWLARESAGQCGPCRFGLPSLAADVAALNRGDARGRASATRHAQLVTGRGACAHPDGAARFVSTGLALLGREVERHARHGSCGRPVLGQLPLPSQGW